MASILSWFSSRGGAWLLIGALVALAGCSTPALLLGAAGVATDTSVTWEVVKHLHGKLTEGDDIPCQRLNSVQRAVNLRCGDFVPGSVRVADLRQSGLQDCPLGVAVRDPRLWPALPEFIEKGAWPQACAKAPLVELAQAEECPDFAGAPPAVHAALRRIADADARSVPPDVLRLLSCPSARLAGLDTVLDGWLAAGALDPGRLGFGALGALHPGHLNSALAQALEARGHTARAGFGGFAGPRTHGFELALRQGDRDALGWWLTRLPELANRVPAERANQLPWLPLARVLTPSFLDDPARRADLVGFLLARGADPWQRLPYDSARNVVQYAQTLNSPLVALLDPPRAAPTVVASTTLRVH